MSGTVLLCIDFQKEFTHPSGKWHEQRPSTDFVRDELIPFLIENGLTTAEIISDYRQPRPGDPRDCCRPGEEGYKSDIPNEVRHGQQWIKAMNSPIWTRENIGIAGKRPGIPYQDPEAFGNWLEKNVAPYRAMDLVVLFGLTLDCCVLSAAQELRWRGYRVAVLAEGTDTRSGDREEKEYLLLNPPLIHWAQVINWDELKNRL